MSVQHASARGAVAALAVWLISVGAAPLSAQYFGRNKVHYETFDFRVLDTDHYSIHYYPAEDQATQDAARMAERWYTRLSQVLGHEYNSKPLIFYANQPDFQQTNVIGGFIDQGTGGVTEPARTRVIMPFTGVYANNDHVLGHELVHTFQFDIASDPRSGGLRGMGALPLWVIEGMAEYLSVGREDPLTAMWLRDALLHDDIPTIRQLSDPRYFPYRYGQALWAYIGGTYGDAVVGQLYRAAIRRGWEAGIARVIGMSSDTLSARWHEAIRAAYAPAMEGRTAPTAVGRQVLSPTEDDRGEMDITPTVSPDGKHVAFYSGRALFTVDLYVANAETGEIEQQLSSPNVDEHYDALSFISSSGSWSPDGTKLAFVIYAEGDNQLAIYDTESENIVRRMKIEGVDALSDPAWGPGDRIAFSGSSGGISDLYVLDLASERVVRLTDDRYADLQPAWSPDGQTLAFASDRGPGTDFARLTYAPMRLNLIDLGSRQIRSLPIFEGAKHINPQFSPDGTSLYFISDREGFSDVYRMSLGDGSVYQVTRTATGVSGITALSPAISVAQQTGVMLLSVFDRGGYTIRRLEASETTGRRISIGPAHLEVAGMLPPATPPTRSLVAEYLADATSGLPTTAPLTSSDYDPDISLEYLGSPTAGVAVNTAGQSAVGGSIAAYFADLLEDKILVTSAGGAGSFKDIGAGVFYLNQKHRWSYGGEVSHTPFLSGLTSVADTTFSDGNQEVNGQVVEQLLQRLYFDRVMGVAQYPFSQTRRIEGRLGYTRVGYDYDLNRFAFVGGRLVGEADQNVNAPPALNLAQASIAYVGDYSYFGFTSPIAGGRYRFEISPTVGSLTYGTALADYRRYLFLRPVSFAFRFLHYGRYGRDAENPNLSPLFVGQENLVRGYSVESFNPAECTLVANTRGCPEFDRLIGSRIGVFNAELRIPLLGTDQLGLIALNLLPVEIAPFFDAGVAWRSNDDPVFAFKRNTTDRVPVFSTGVAARINLFGYVVLESYYAYPFQRPERGWHFGFNLAPGW